MCGLRTECAGLLDLAIADESSERWRRELVRPMSDRTATALSRSLGTCSNRSKLLCVFSSGFEDVEVAPLARLSFSRASYAAGKGRKTAARAPHRYHRGDTIHATSQSAEVMMRNAGLQTTTLWLVVVSQTRFIGAHVSPVTRSESRGEDPSPEARLSRLSRLSQLARLARLLTATDRTWPSLSISHMEFGFHRSKGSPPRSRHSYIDAPLQRTIKDISILGRKTVRLAPNRGCSGGYAGHAEATLFDMALRDRFVFDI